MGRVVFLFLFVAWWIVAYVLQFERGLVVKFFEKYPPGITLLFNVAFTIFSIVIAVWFVKVSFERVFGQRKIRWLLYAFSLLYPSLVIAGLTAFLIPYLFWRSLFGRKKEEVKVEKKEYTPIHRKPERKVEEEKVVSLAEAVQKVGEIKVEDLEKDIVGQRRALEEVVRGLTFGVKKAFMGDPKRARVLSSMLFVGATGVGKTETAKKIAEMLKPYGYEFIRIDLNMYSTRESSWTLIGSPRGYVGSEQGGTLTRALMKNPRAVILFDEMEKAHPDLHTVFMTLLDEGYVEEQSTGVKVYLEGGIIIFTSNLYADQIADLAERVRGEVELEMGLREYVERYFGRPEIVGRIDRIVPFGRLDEKDLREIARRILARHFALPHLDDVMERYLPVARKYGVRVFMKKVEEFAIEHAYDIIPKKQTKIERKGRGFEVFPDGFDKPSGGG